MTNSQNLAQCMTAGRLPVPDVFSIAAAVAEQLREMHAQGRAHGALTPEAVEITDSGLELLPADVPGITPYTAPEVLLGYPADARSDIFSFGAIVYEMFTGRRAFEGMDERSLAGALLDPAPPPSGSRALDRLVTGCVAKSPDARFQRVEKLQLEVRMLASAARRGAPLQPAIALAADASYAMPARFAAAAPAPLPPAPGPSEMEALEARITARMQEQERSVAGVERVANEILKALRGQQSGAGHSSGFDRPPARGYAEFRDLESDSPPTRLDRAFELLSDKLARIDVVVGSAVERLKNLEQNLDAFDTEAASLRDSVTRDIRNFERSLKAQITAIESTRTAMGQTDDLVERVVEALDSLQSMFITRADECAAS